METQASSHREIDMESDYFKPNLDYNYPFPIDSALNGLPLSAESIGKG